MTTPKKILVTGASGTIGSRVVRELTTLAAGKDIAIRAAARKPPSQAGIETVDLALGDTASVDRALADVDAAFLLTPFAEDQVALGKHFIDRAKARGVKRIVKLSAFGAEVEPGIELGRWHRAVEKHLEASGLAFTILRPNNYMQNFTTYYPPDKEGVIYLPWGDAKCSFIDGDDVARVAAVTLLEAGHEGKAYTLTGPEAFGIADAAKTISAVSGRAITYVDVPEAAAKQAMLGLGLPAWMVNGMLELHALDKAGHAAVITGEVEKITKKKPRTFAELAKENAAAWKL